MKSVTKKVNDIGLVLFEKSSRARHINISIKPFRGIRIAVPFGSSLKNAEEVVRSKANWIKRNLKKVQQLEQKHKINAIKLNDIDKLAGRKKLTDRLNELSVKYGFTYNNVRIRNQKSRWGSCSAQNNINLNIKLILLPPHLVDYVILHELVHTNIKNHSREFWSTLNIYVDDAKTLNKELKHYGVDLL